jgi:hypothetical protein
MGHEERRSFGKGKPKGKPVKWERRQARKRKENGLTLIPKR